MHPEEDQSKDVHEKQEGLAGQGHDEDQLGSLCNEDQVDGKNDEEVNER